MSEQVTEQTVRCAECGQPFVPPAHARDGEDSLRAEYCAPCLAAAEAEHPEPAADNRMRDRRGRVIETIYRSRRQLKPQRDPATLNRTREQRRRLRQMERRKKS